MKKVELLAPAGDMEKLKVAINYGADAVYFAGKKFGLRAFSGNFESNEIAEAIAFAHSHGVKCYITVNILAHENDFDGLVDYLKSLEKDGADGVIVADMGIASYVKKYTNLELHVSTQANITNSASALAWVALGAKRLVLARELSIVEIKQIRDAVGPNIDIECFCHGAMCISYSGRCLLSNYFTGRDSNRGACAQPCRWNYKISVADTPENEYPIMEDERGTYILNSKDMCLINHLNELVEAGITSFKIEGRMKSPYYVATVVNAYRRALNELGKKPSFNYVAELEKTGHRKFTTGFYFGAEDKENIESSKTIQTYEFIAVVLEDAKNGYATVEMRNRFKIGETLEVLSPTETFNQNFVVTEILDENGVPLTDATHVQEKLKLKTNLNLKANDILRRENKKQD
ncbi:MAG: U32 family peptidase [Clostridia bacterium]|nr:U32 family peptidase [Clostridia bacterium]